MHLANEAIAEACRLPVRAALCAVVAAGCALVANGAPVSFRDAAWLRYCTACVELYKDVVDEWEIWNEPFNQAKWNLRRAIGDASRSIPSSVFTMIDLQYTFMLQSFGLIRSNTLKEFVYRRPSYFAMQNVSWKAGGATTSARRSRVRRRSASRTSRSPACRATNGSAAEPRASACLANAGKLTCQLALTARWCAIMTL